MPFLPPLPDSPVTVAFSSSQGPHGGPATKHTEMDTSRQSGSLFPHNQTKVSANLQVLPPISKLKMNQNMKQKQSKKTRKKNQNFLPPQIYLLTKKSPKISSVNPGFLISANVKPSHLRGHVLRLHGQAPLPLAFLRLGVWGNVAIPGLPKND